MLQQMNQTETRDLEWSCESVSPMAEPRATGATFTAVSAGGGSVPSMP